MDADERRRRSRERTASYRRRRKANGGALGSRRKSLYLVVARPAMPDLTDGHCAGLGDLMFPEGEGRRDLVDAAIRVCCGCPLRQLCLDYAIRARERHGIWGGRDFDQQARREARALTPTDIPAGNDDHLREDRHVRIPMP